MPPIWKILIIACICLGITPSWGFEQSNSGIRDLVTQEGQSNRDDEEVVESLSNRTLIAPVEREAQGADSVSDLITEKVKVDEEQPQTATDLKEKPKVQNEEFVGSGREAEASQEEGTKATRTEAESLGVLQSADPQVLETLGIKRLSKGINIFRFSTYYLKHSSPLVKARSLPGNPIQ